MQKKRQCTGNYIERFIVPYLPCSVTFVDSRYMTL